MISENLLPDVQDRIREYVIGLPRDEAIDTVMIATILLHYVPNREVNAWMVLVAPQGEAKTRLMTLVADHPAAWKLPDKMTGGYFLNSRAMHNSALFRFAASDARVFICTDMSTITDGIAFQYQGDIDSQFRNIHDGHYKLETGLNSQPMEWGPMEPHETPGFLGAGTETFYDYLRRSHLLGSRFMCYFMDPGRHRHWTDTADLEQIQRRHAELAPQRDSARSAVHNFIDQVIPYLDRVHRVEVSGEVDAQIAAASRFVGRILGAGKLQDAGTRRAVRVRELCRVVALMRGHTFVERDDVALGIRIIFSQLPPDLFRLTAYALAHRKGWHMPTLLSDLGSTRKTFDPHVQALVDIDVLRQSGTRGGPGYLYAPSTNAMRLVERFDGDGRLFAQLAVASQW